MNEVPCSSFTYNPRASLAEIKALFRNANGTSVHSPQQSTQSSTSMSMPGYSSCSNSYTDCEYFCKFFLHHFKLIDAAKVPAPLHPVVHVSIIPEHAPGSKRQFHTPDNSLRVYMYSHGYTPVGPVLFQMARMDCRARTIPQLRDSQSPHVDSSGSLLSTAQVHCTLDILPSTRTPLSRITYAVIPLPRSEHLNIDILKSAQYIIVPDAHGHVRCHRF